MPHALLEESGEELIELERRAHQGQSKQGQLDYSISNGGIWGGFHPIGFRGSKMRFGSDLQGTESITIEFGGSSSSCLISSLWMILG